MTQHTAVLDTVKCLEMEVQPSHLKWASTFFQFQTDFIIFWQDEIILHQDFKSSPP